MTGVSNDIIQTPLIKCAKNEPLILGETTDGCRGNDLCGVIAYSRPALHIFLTRQIDIKYAVN